MESGTFQIENLDHVARREDELGQLARVFQRMAQQVYAREQYLKHQVQALQIEIDRTCAEHQVKEITETSYFKELQRQAKGLRKKFHSNEASISVDEAGPERLATIPVDEPALV